jgi:hypothetical protein
VQGWLTAIADSKSTKVASSRNSANAKNPAKNLADAEIRQ